MDTESAGEQDDALLQRRVLMVTLRYPPTPGAGIIQTLKYQKYLPQHGWVGDTLTGPRSGTRAALSAEPATEGTGKTYRVNFPDPLRTAQELAAASGHTRVRRGLARLLRQIGRYAMVPDPHLLFVPAVMVRASALAEDCDVLYASGMPWSSLVAAAALKVRSKRPLVLGLRDPWIEPRGYGRVRNRLEAVIEGATLRAADVVVVTAAGLKDELLARRPWLAEKVRVITNGYDEEDFQGPPAPPLSAFDIVHTGNFYGKKGPSTLFEGVRRWTELQPWRRSQVRVRLVGKSRPTDVEAAKTSGIEDIVVFESPVPQQQAVARLLSARVVVAIDFDPEHARTRVLSKTFECMRSGRPILFLSSNGGTEEILRPCPRAVIVPKDDPTAVALALESIASLPNPTSTFRPDDYTRQFERSVLAGHLAKLLDEVRARRKAQS